MSPIVSDNPRLVAFNALKKISEGSLTPEEALEKLGSLLSSKDKALAAALVYECERHRSRLDFIFESKLRDKSNIKSILKIILRLGVCQLLFLDKVPDYAAVSQTVDLTKNIIPGLDKLVNAVLMAVIRDKAQAPCWPVETDQSKREPVERLAIFYSHPLWMVKNLAAQLGLRETRALLAANNVHPGPSLRVNPLKIDRSDFIKCFSPSAEPTLLSPWGLKGLKWEGRVENWPGYKQGLFAIQDEASQLLPLICANPETIIDCCAGLGGKALALAGVFPQSSILCLDKHSWRLQSLVKEAQRLGLKAPKTMAVDLLTINSSDLGQFSLALLDAPCSGLGVIRRRPDLKWRKNPGDPARLGKMQLRMLLKAAELTAPGGRLIYSVCTITSEEGPEVIKRFLAHRQDFRPLKNFEMESSFLSLCVGTGQLRLWPHKHDTDGFFYALMERKL
ncbi:MAG: 16S rRNA (cytosine(967)-C(5))-methyltransferase RsmB [Deltaproteobacteria bacterium]|jgi:16S rRNA (cytosine967-C5)-methyltransferase|nr:16S rRNA (cytosine(967)-C(5))-methyltransferase RsmB [Deltaproteobacteria bacterium]